ncbi:MAG: hypothetical protein APF76_17335 [Desulfitibacter sp. BRH_c19]|nr:MAG: hypothetical protein APF76_17335 [Desulfitibacter sp. BRH_c19]
MDYILLLFIFVCYYCAGVLRKSNKKRRPQYKTIDPKEGTLSESIVELIAFAGGIYLSLTLLIDFLALTGLERVFFWGISVDPIALASIIFALLQPVYERIRFNYT